MRPETIRQRLIDDRYRRGSRCIAFAEGAAFDESNAHGAEVIGRRDAIVGRRFLAWLRRRHAFGVNG
jgi:hypothetical protein